MWLLAALARMQPAAESQAEDVYVLGSLEPRELEPRLADCAECAAEVAWARYRAGRFADAEAASRQARRTGTVDRRILAHAEVIDRAVAMQSRGPDTGTRTPPAPL